MGTFRTTVACDTCGALHAISGEVPAGPQPAVIASLPCRACHGICRAVLPAAADLSAARVELKEKPETLDGR